jgi:PAS domain S-box-containing protein
VAPQIPIKVLLIDDDEEDYIITRDLLSDMPGNHFTVDWAGSFEAGLNRLLLNQHDVCLVDYRLGPRSGIELLRAATERGCQAPVILLTGAGEHVVDVEAMQAGAADYLVKAQLRADALERSIRYAMERRRAAAAAAAEQGRLASFGAEVGRVLTHGNSLDALLQACTESMVRYLNAGMAQLDTFDSEKKILETRAISGPLASGMVSPAFAPTVRMDFDELARGKALLLKKVELEARNSQADWIRREGISSYAAFPLVVEDRLVGLMSLYARHQLGGEVLQEMGSVANGIALCIERKRSEEALDLSEVKYKSVVESIKEVIFQLDAFGNWAFLNPAWTAVTGFEVQRTLGSSILDYISPEDRGQIRQSVLNLIEKKTDFCRQEARLCTRDGRIRWVEFYAQATFDKRREVNGVSGTLADITDRKAAELQIQKLAAFPKRNPNPVLEFDTDGVMTYANDAAYEMARAFNREDLLSILPPHPDQIVRGCFAAGQKVLGQEVVIDRNILSWSFFPIAGSHVVHCYGADVTEFQNLEAQLRHSQKLDSIGQLAAGVAHDFNNILTVIQGYTETLLMGFPENPRISPALKQISMAAQRAAGLTRHLLTFSRKQVVQLKVLDLNLILRNLSAILSRLVGEDVAIESSYAAGLPCIEADSGMVEQIVMNLAVNARDAMPKGGRLLITTSLSTIGPDHSRIHADARPGEFVCLTMNDSGCGMDRATLGRIFEPFFTTKEVGKGTGLGLATVYGIVKQHKGWIEVASEIGRGSTFRIYIPAIPNACAMVTDARPPAGTSVGRQESILLVEDELVLREFVSEVLRQNNYNVITAGSGVEALEVWKQHPDGFDLLLTDMVMPQGMSGLDLARELNKRQPELKVIFSSGYSAEIVGDGFKPEEVWFLPKPYQPMQLTEIVRQRLDAHASSAAPGMATRTRSNGCVGR